MTDAIASPHRATNAIAARTAERAYLNLCRRRHVGQRLANDRTGRLLYPTVAAVPAWSELMSAEAMR